VTPALRALLAAVRRRDAWVAVLPALPWLLALAVLWVLGSRGTGLALPALIAAAVLAWRLQHQHHLWRRHDGDWLLQRLQDLRPELEDSADLIALDPARLGVVQRLQRERVLDRLRQRALPALHAALPWRLTAAMAMLAALAALVPQLLPKASIPAAVEPSTTPAPPAVQQLDVALQVMPPDYTGRPPREGNQLAVEVEQDSRLRWSLGFAIAPRSVQLVFVDGNVLSLTPENGRFVGERDIATATLYRVETEGAPAVESELQRIDVISDRAPQLRVLAPERTLTQVEAAQRAWNLNIEAEDDYGLQGATLTLTLAQGSGEQVTVSERRLSLRGEGDARRRRYRHLVDLTALGYGRGDDLIARLEVRDNREPEAKTSRSPALILRWPYRPSAEGSGVEGLVQRTLPAYFRSQRQIIIDTEALIAERPQLDEDTLLGRSDAIGVDQRILRLRYGQFLGEEDEAGTLPGSGPAASEDGDQHDDHAHDEGQHGDHDHEHGASSSPAAGAGFGEVGGLIAEVGHMHDIAEAATLLDPKTRELLRGALREMWSAEGHLRLGQPEAALPFEYRALELIKQVQQANRIYLARVGLELPAVDFSRRLSGEKRPRGLAADPLVAARDERSPLRGWWLALHGEGELPIKPMSDWLQATPDALADPLAALAELDALRRDSGCQPCRRRLADLLWPQLPQPAAGALPRPDGGAVGTRYLEALEATP
jgi:hypothetical protein